MQPKKDREALCQYVSLYNIKKSEKNLERLEKRELFLQDFQENGIFKAAEHQGMPVGAAAKRRMLSAMISKIKNRVKAILKLR